MGIGLSDEWRGMPGELPWKVRNFIEENGMLEPGDRVIVAVSGGADSVCLLWMLCAFAPELPVSLRALHVHHGLRGAEADRDEAFVRELCERLSVPFLAEHCDVRGYAGARGLSEEEAGRILRYEALERQAAAWDREAAAGERETAVSGQGTAASEGRTKIAVAHHRDDNAETILHHLLRGSGLRGLSGIRPVAGRVIRPLLGAGREEIRGWLKSRGLPWCEDSTNGSGDYTRNRIRNEVLPLLKETVNARAEENILHAGRLFAQVDDYMAQAAAKVWDRAGVQEQAGAQEQADARAVGIGLDEFRGEPEIIRSYLIRHMLDMLASGMKDVTARHFAGIGKLAGSPVGSRMDLPGGLEAAVDYDRLWIRRRISRRVSRCPEKPGAGVFLGTGPGDGSGDPSEDLPEDAAGSMEMSIFSRQKTGEIPKNQYTKWFDYDKIRDTLSVRTRREGDFLTLPGGHTKAVRRYMIDEKIPRKDRDRILLLAEGNHVLWVVGYRISEYYKITDNTTTILQVTFNGGEEHGRQSSCVDSGGTGEPPDQ